MTTTMPDGSGGTVAVGGAVGSWQTGGGNCQKLQSGQWHSHSLGMTRLVADPRPSRFKPVEADLLQPRCWRSESMAPCCSRHRPSCSRCHSSNSAVEVCRAMRLICGGASGMKLSICMKMAGFVILRKHTMPFSPSAPTIFSPLYIGLFMLPRSNQRSTSVGKALP